MRNVMVCAVILTALVIVTHYAFGQAQDIWVGKDGNIRNVYAKDMVSSGGDFYLATKSEVYKSRDVKEGWQPVFSIPAGGNEINCIGGYSRTVFIGTKRGLFRSDDRGKKWSNVFRTVIPGKNCVNCMDSSMLPSRIIIIGTENGVFYSDNSGDGWDNISANLKDRINCVSLKDGVIFAGGDSGLYFRTAKARGWERLFVASRPEKQGEGLEAPEEPAEEDEEMSDAVRCMSVKGKRLYIGIGKDIKYSDDGGKSWRDLAREGLAGDITGILPSEKFGKLYCSTERGVFEFSAEDDRWRELYKGIGKNVSINSIIFDGGDERHLWALTDKGIFRMESGSYMMDQRIDVEKPGTLKALFAGEPTFRQLQKAAIDFAEVNPEKIKNWRTQARLKALMPKVSCGMDSNRSTNYQIYTSATKDYVVGGPDDISGGWDFSISWDLGDLVWGTDQTSIDVRSRLMVQLRNDILDDLRRAYYERRRVQYELAAEPPQDPKVRFEKELRLSELTQAIDDLTGNYLSENARKPEEVKGK